jgi:hypothetical protein
METFNLLKGYKTYLVAAATAVYGVVARHSSLQVLAPYVLTGLGLAALRAAVAKVEQGVAALESKLPTSVQTVVDPVVKKVEKAVNDDVAAATK